MDMFAHTTKCIWSTGCHLKPASISEYISIIYPHFRRNNIQFSDIKMNKHTKNLLNCIKIIVIRHETHENLNFGFSWVYLCFEEN